MKKSIQFALVGLLAAGSFALGALLLRPSPSAAQGAVQSGEIAPGPGGMWVLRGDRLYVCREPLVRSAARAAQPPTPECGVAVRVP